MLAGQGTRDHARAAIQVLSGAVPRELRFAHLGWRDHGGEPVYVHAGGAIGAGGVVADVRVALEAPFDRFVLPAPPAAKPLARAVRTRPKVLDVAPDVLTIPLFAAVWRVALGGTDFSHMLVGPSGQPL